MLVKDRDFKEFVSADEIQTIVKRLAAKVDSDFEGKNPYYLVMMNGAFIFAADFVRYLNHSITLGCVKYTSYEGMHSTGSITPVLPIPTNVKDRNVVLLEDMVDTGQTMEFFLKEIAKFQPKSVTVVSLFSKPDVLNNRVKIDYLGMSLPNKFVVGYGLDYDGCGRNFPALYYTE
ncbi:MAG: hypoxanthine phosphoribosyltransferase [Paludibacteraceae bacterium]|nr:hypoxanthine phosphoribosyltransferase [Paludibacteraceae bacterium]